MLKLSLCDYSDGYILVKGGTLVENSTTPRAAANNNNEEAAF